MLTVPCSRSSSWKLAELIEGSSCKQLVSWAWVSSVEYRSGISVPMETSTSVSLTMIGVSSAENVYGASLTLKY